MAHWLLKSEPETFGIDHLAAGPEATTSWDGVRNYQARNFLRDSMKKGDTRVLLSLELRSARHRRHRTHHAAGYPDLTAFDPQR